MELEALIEARPSARKDICGWYRQLLEQSDQAGLSTADLATRLGCSRETIYAWRRRLKSPSGEVSKSGKRQLVRVQVAEPLAAASADRVEVRTRCGRSILVPDTFDPATLAAIVGVLEQC